MTQASKYGLNAPQPVLSFPVLALFFVLCLTVSANAAALDTIAFGSCVHQDEPQPIWDAVIAEEPDLFVFLGDNIYGDSDDPEVLRAKYEKQASNPGFSNLIDTTPIIAMWDDHDYGENDGGKQYPSKHASRSIMLDFWKEPANSIRRTRSDGIYTSYLYGEPDRRVQVILLDLRWNRTALTKASGALERINRTVKNMGPYAPTADPSAALLGEQQWRWLAQQLSQPAEVRIIGSSIQLLPEFSGWESWANFPHERARLFELVRKVEAKGVVLISGDTHWSEISRLDEAVPYPLWEMTSSGLTEEWKLVSPNRHRVGEPYSKANYGLIKIDWEQPDPEIRFSIRDVTGETVMEQTLKLSVLR